MANLTLMKKGPATMNVPADKVQQYLADGWEEIKREPVPDEPKAVDVEGPNATDVKATEKKAAAEAKAAEKKAAAEAKAQAEAAKK